MKALTITEFKAAFVAASDAGTAFILSSPLWVQIWVGIMMLVLLPAFVLMFKFREARWVAWSMIILGVWTPVLVMAVGASRLWGITHLSFWTPVLCVVVASLVRNGTEGKYQKWLMAVAAVISISLVFDVLDVIRFIGGEV